LSGDGGSNLHGNVTHRSAETVIFAVDKLVNLRRQH